MDRSLVIERTFQFFGIVMTIVLFVVLRKILRQVQDENRAEAAKLSEPSNPS